MAKLYELEGKRYEFPDDVSDSEAIAFIEAQSPKPAETAAGRIADAGKAAFYQTTQGLAGLAMLGGVDAADTIAEFERDMPAQSEEMSRFQKAQGWGEAIKEVFNDWETIPTLLVSGLTGSYPAIAGGVAGAAALNPATAAAGVGIGSLATEAGNEMLQVFREEGVNLKDAQAVRSAFNNPDLVSKAKTKALQRGVPVAAFDALSAGVAGKLLGPAIKRGRGIARAAAGEAVIQGGFGGLGEVSASVASGEKIEPSAVIAEVVSELASSGPEVGANIAKSVAREARSVGLNNVADAVEKGPITGIKEAVAAQGKADVEATPTEASSTSALPDQPTLPAGETAVSGKTTTQTTLGGETQDGLRQEAQGQEANVVQQPATEQATQTETPAAPPEPQMKRMVESGERAESQGGISGEYVTSTGEATEQWARREVRKFKGDLPKAISAANRTQMTDKQRNLVQAEILTQATRAYATDPTDLAAFEIVQSLPSVMRQAGTEQGQALESRKKMLQKIEPYAAVISYVSGAQIRALGKLPKAARKLVSSFRKEEFERIASVADQEASQPTTIVDCG